MNDPLGIEAARNAVPHPVSGAPTWPEHGRRWKPDELTKGRRYQYSTPDKWATYMGIDVYMGQATHWFKLDDGRSTYITDAQVSQYLVPRKEAVKELPICGRTESQQSCQQEPSSPKSNTPSTIVNRG